MLRRTAFALAILATSPAIAAADSNTAGNPDSTDLLSVLAFAILIAGLALIAVPEKTKV